MIIIRSVKEMQIKIKNLRKQNKIGFVPTMGYFHQGHLSLMKAAKEENDIVVTSIFVNPLQFGPNEDYERYPRNEERDMQLAKNTGVDILFIPEAKDMYPSELAISMKVNKRANVLCGKSRPNHFDGVVTVVAKLFNIVLPDKVYFGMKDAQQLAIIEALISDFNFPIELVGLPTVRETDGLAKSSRNVYLNEEEKNEAVWLQKALLVGQQLITRGERSPNIVSTKIKEIINKETTGIIDYVEVLSYPGLEPITTINEQIIIATAVTFNKTRLIDNLLLDEDGKILTKIGKL